MVASSRIMFVLFAVVVLTLGQSSRPVSAWLAGEVLLEIQNVMDPSKAKIEVHCKSGDDDLQNHVLEYGKIYSFKFENNALDTTLFYCYFQWKNPEGKWIQTSHDIYDAKRDQERCMHHCQWRVAEEGFFSYSIKNDVWENLYNWT
ncbi:hypothetical protein ACFX13_032758 [Malus domestica]|uniref:S-protein homolog 5-like n=1 Tax=Malus sylvestris TaxID=3752 RepID=UPI0021AC370E|nr:S-protein homolog 5-like [Malus sylvestris]